jgi:arabinosaccharide transport system permease protein
MVIQQIASPANTRAIIRRRGVGMQHVGLLTLYVPLVLGVVVTAAPFIWTLFASFKTNADIFQAPVTFWPRLWTLDSYQRLLSGEQIPFLRQFANSALLAIGETLLTVLLASLAGFAFAKYEFAGKRVLFALTLLILMIPFEVVVVPLFQLMVGLGWINTFQAVILPGAINAFGVFFMRQTMLVIPDELLDAARIDGATEFVIFWRIALPLSRGGLGVLALLSFLRSWNDYLWPLIALRSPEMFTLPIGLATLSGLYKVEWGMIMAGAVLATLPILAIFMWAREQLITGLTSGALKG